MQITLYSDDVTLLLHWEKALEGESYKLIYDFQSLKELKDSIIILNDSSFEEDYQSFFNVMKSNNCRVLVLDRIPELNKAKKLLKYGAFGYGNALMRAHFILAAISAIKEGMIWLYPELTSQLILEIPDQQSKNSSELLEKLTAREKEVAELLKNGLIYNEIAQQLNISSRTVKAHAHSIYNKLDIKDRLELVLLLK